MENYLLVRRLVPIVIVGTILPACSFVCTSKTHLNQFSGIEATAKTQLRISQTGGRVEVKTIEAGTIVADIPIGALPDSETVEIISKEIPEISEEFLSHPYTGNLKKLPGAIRLIIGKKPPEKDITLCFDRLRVFQSRPGLEVIPIVHSYYDGENETLSYFNPAEHYPGTKENLECINLRKEQFSNLDSPDDRFETIVVFAERILGK